MISKKLMQELMKNLTVKEIISTGNNKVDNNIYYKVEEIDILQSTNIFELAHKCKEWAVSKGYNIWSSAYGCECYIDGRNLVNNENIRFLACNEPEAIFKACEWILKQKDIKW
jgi:hypothetical protein